MIFRNHSVFCLLMIRRPPRSTRTDTLFPYRTLCRSPDLADTPCLDVAGGRHPVVEAALAKAGERFVPNDVSLCGRSEEHTSELQSLMRISYAVVFLHKKTDDISYTL